MGRTPNKTPPSPNVIVVPLYPHEFAWLKRNAEPPPKADGKRRPLGGYPLLENWCVANYRDGRIVFDPVRFERLWNYIKQQHGSGGPNNRLRRCFIPALRRIGRDPLPEWAVK